MSAAWYDPTEDEEDTDQCAWCCRWVDHESMVRLDYPDDAALCQGCWRQELADHPERYGVCDDG